MVQSNLLKSFLEGTPPKAMRLLAARGLLPLPPADLMELLVFLSKDADPEIATQAEKTLASWTDDEMLPYVQSRECRPDVLMHIARISSSAPVLEAIILNPATPGEAIEKLAPVVPGPLLETILINRVRLLEFPGILKNVRQNPAATPQILGLVTEIEFEFFSGKKKEYAVEETVAVEEEPAADFQELVLELAPEDLTLEGLPLDPDAREEALYQKLSQMSVRDKIKFALMGTREARAILIRDTNKEVSRAVLHSPKLTENEVEGFTAMRNISEEILREIGNSRLWTRSYVVAQNLVKNPKTPPTISQRMLYRLQTRDLAILARDRSVPEAVRRNAQRTYSQRTTQRAR